MDVVRALIIVLAGSVVCGRLALLVGQPRVVGEMISGVLLGPTLLGGLAPGLSAGVFSPQVKSVLYTIAVLGLTLYMFLVGAGQSHTPSSARELTAPLVLALSCFLAPLVVGTLTALALEVELNLPGVSPLQYCLFVGGALSLTAFPMLARILYERDMVHTRFGGLAMLAASVDDAAGWCALAVISALGRAGGMSAALTTIGLAIAFCGVTLTVVPRLLRGYAERAVAMGRFPQELLAVVMLLVLAAGWFTDYIGIFSVFGGFVTGMAMPDVPAFRRMIHDRMMEMTTVLLLPVFFAYSGLNTHLGSGWTWSFVGALAALILAGFVGKYIAGLLTMRGLGFDWRAASAMGGLMNARGLMILIFINLGLAQGIIGDRLFGLLVLVAVITTAMAMPIYRATLSESDEAAARAELLLPGGPSWRRGADWRGRRPEVHERI
ncbi:MAG: cation:proton antiporter [Pseudonocardiaceae bacterium]